MTQVGAYNCAIEKGVSGGSELPKDQGKNGPAMGKLQINPYLNTLNWGKGRLGKLLQEGRKQGEKRWPWLR